MRKVLSEDLHIAVPKGWKAALNKIANSLDMDRSQLSRRALVKAHPELREIELETKI